MPSIEMQKRKMVIFKPQPDITAFELAQIAPWKDYVGRILKEAVSEHLLRHYEDAGWVEFSVTVDTRIFEDGNE